VDAYDKIYDVINHRHEVPIMRCHKGALLFPVGRTHGDIVQYHCERCQHIVEKTMMELLVYDITGSIKIDCRDHLRG